jgi:hypothetical protein
MFLRAKGQRKLSLDQTDVTKERKALVKTIPRNWPIENNLALKNILHVLLIHIKE